MARIVDRKDSVPTEQHMETEHVVRGELARLDYVIHTTDSTDTLDQVTVQAGMVNLIGRSSGCSGTDSPHKGWWLVWDAGGILDRTEAVQTVVSRRADVGRY